TPEALDAAKAAAAIMGMNNVFYRFKHLTSNEKYATMRGGLRMNVMKTHGIDPLDFELWCTVVSAINNCAACVDAHEKTLREKGLSEEKVLAAVRIAAVLHAVAVVPDTPIPFRQPRLALISQGCFDGKALAGAGGPGSQSFTRHTPL